MPFNITNLNRVVSLSEADAVPDPVNRGRVYPDYPVSVNPNLLPEERLFELGPEFLAMRQANDAQIAAGGISQTQPQSLSGGMFTPEPNFTSGQQPQQQSVVAGMFPEVEAMQRALYQQKQNEAMQAQAMQFARLSPMEQAQYSLYMGGQQLGGAIGGALGGKDPQLQQISMRNAIMKRLDPSNPAQQMKIAQEIAQYDPEFAMSIADNARKSAIQIRQASSAARQGTTEKLQILDRLNQVNDALQTISPDAPEYKTLLNNKYLLESQLKKVENTPAKIQEAQTVAINKGFTEGTPEFNAEVVKYLEKTEKEPSVGSDREAIAKDMFFKPFSQLTQEQIKAVNAKKKEDDLDAAKATAPSSGIKEFKDIPKLRADIISTIAPFRATVNATDFALENLDLSIKQNNFSAFNAARVQLAKSLAGGDLSQKEIQAAGGDPSIIGGLVDMASTAFSGTPSTDTQEKIKATIKAIRKVALQKGRAEIEAQRTLAKRSNFTDEDFDLASDIPEFRKKPSLKTTESDDALVNKYLTKKP